MRPFFTALAFGVSVAVLAGVRAIAGAPAPALDEVRGLWVQTASLSSPARIAAMVREATSGGFNTLLVQVRARGEAYYRSTLDPRASDLESQPSTFDPLGATLDAAHRAGLRVHAWINVDLVASSTTLPRSRDHVVSRHPEWLMVPRTLAESLRNVDVRSPGYVGQLARWTRSVNDQVEGLYLSPITDASQDYSASLVGEIAWKYPVDGIHLDYVRYPNNTFDYSAAAIAAFRANRLPFVSAAERQRLDEQALTDATAWTNAFPEGWATYRRDRLTTLVARLATVARAARPGLVVSAAVGPDADDAHNGTLQNWRAWTASGVLDAICPMAYTPGVDEFTKLVTQARLTAGKTPVWAGIGAYLLPVAGAADHVRAARRAGVAGVVLFSYESLATADARTTTYFAGLKRVLLETASGSGTVREISNLGIR